MPPTAGRRSGAPRASGKQGRRWLPSSPRPPSRLNQVNASGSADPALGKTLDIEADGSFHGNSRRWGSSRGSPFFLACKGRDCGIPCRRRSATDRGSAGDPRQGRTHDGAARAPEANAEAVRRVVSSEPFSSTCARPDDWCPASAKKLPGRPPASGWGACRARSRRDASARCIWGATGFVRMSRTMADGGGIRLLPANDHNAGGTLRRGHPPEDNRSGGREPGPSTSACAALNELARQVPALRRQRPAKELEGEYRRDPGRRARRSQRFWRHRPLFLVHRTHMGDDGHRGQKASSRPLRPIWNGAPHGRGGSAQGDRAAPSSSWLRTDIFFLPLTMAAGKATMLAADGHRRLFGSDLHGHERGRIRHQGQRPRRCLDDVTAGPTSRANGFEGFKAEAPTRRLATRKSPRLSPGSADRHVGGAGPGAMCAARPGIGELATTNLYKITVDGTRASTFSASTAARRAASRAQGEATGDTPIFTASPTRPRASPDRRRLRAHPAGLLRERWRR